MTLCQGREGSKGTFCLLPSGSIPGAASRALKPQQLPLSLMDAGGGSGGAERTRSSDPQHELLPLVRSGPALATGPAGFGGCSGDSEPRGVSLWVPRVCQPSGGTAWVQPLLEKQQIQNILLLLCFPLPCLSPSAPLPSNSFYSM